MSHANARLTLHGRRLLVDRVRNQGQPIAHVAAAMGISRQCAHRWVNRFDAHGEAGLHERSSRPHHSPNKTSPAREEEVLQARAEHRRGQDWLAAATGVPARTINRILHRHRMPALAVLDPMTGEMIRSSKATAVRYEKDRPGELVHVDVKKLGKIPEGGGWRAHGREAMQAQKCRRPKIGYDYVHSMVDDCSRLSYSEVLPDETGASCAGFLERAAAYFAEHGIRRIERVMTDNAFAYKNSQAFMDAVARLGARQKFIRPHCPWQNGKVERYNRTLAQEWAYRRVWTSSQERAEGLAGWVQEYNTERAHTSLGGMTPAQRVSLT